MERGPIVGSSPVDRSEPGVSLSGTTSRALLFDAGLVFGNWMMRLPGHRLRLAVLRRIFQVDISGSASVHRHVTLTARRNLTIGDHTVINPHVYLDNRGGITIGSNCSVSIGTRIVTAGHMVDDSSFSGVGKPVVIGNRCWLGAWTLLLPGTSVGEGVILAAGAIARGHLVENSIYASPSAVPVRTRSELAQREPLHYRRFLQ